MDAVVPDSRCANCGAPATGRYCSECGQETALALPTARQFLREAAGRYVALDGRMWRTLAALLFRPGFLTRAYFAGQRRRYVRPARLFLVLSLAMFAVFRIAFEVPPIDVIQGDAPADEAAGAATSAPDQGALLLPGMSVDVDPQVEAIDQRARQPSSVAGALAVGARAAVAADPAGTRVHRRDQQEPGREGGGEHRPGDPDDALLQRLAQRVQHRRGELAQLVEEEDAARGPADLTRPEQARAAPGQRDRRGGVVRRPERPSPHQPAVLQFAGDRGDHRHFQELGRR